uniref:Uncharacterized protein n=1 Tax=Physcomitrium patens TaxID=3218 RepID=A0A2K1IIC8_PHYPA|nr:hypothetical protein PHYPA_027723 [Physcomitrium patens]
MIKEIGSSASRDVGIFPLMHTISHGCVSIFAAGPGVASRREREQLKALSRFVASRSSPWDRAQRRLPKERERERAFTTLDPSRPVESFP